MNKKLLWIIIGVVVLILLLVVLKGGKDEGIKCPLKKIAKRDITEIVTASGKIYPEKEVRSARISPGRSWN